MKINAGQPNPTPNGIGKKGQAGGTDRAGGTEISGKKDFSELVGLHGGQLEKIPIQTARQERLQSIQERIGNATYAPDSETVARNLLKSVGKGGNLLLRPLLVSI